MRRLFWLTSVLCWSLVQAALAGNHYIRANANGKQDGSNWNNAWRELPKELVRGDTYYIADGKYPPYVIDDAVIGKNYIYIKKAIEKDHGTELGWQPSYGDGEALFESDKKNVLVFATSYVDMDGQIGKGAKGYGFRISAKDDVPYPVLVLDPTWKYEVISHIKLRHCDIHHRGAEIFLPEGEFVVDESGDWLIVKNASRFHLRGTDYVRLESTHTMPKGLEAGRGYDGVEYFVRKVDSARNRIQLSNIKRPNEIITGMDAGRGIHRLARRAGSRGFQVGSMTRMEHGLISHCYIHDVPSMPIFLTKNSNHNVIEHCLIARNHSDPVCHGEGIQSGPPSRDNTVRNCVFEDIEGTAVVVGGIGWNVYGNIFRNVNYPNDGQYGKGVGMGVFAGNRKNRVYNNTAYGLVGTNAGIYFAGADNTVHNNIWADCQRIRFSGKKNETGGNKFYLTPRSRHSMDCHEAPSRLDPFVGTRTHDLRLKSPVPGASLDRAHNNTDVTGRIRGADGVWDVGAYEVQQARQ